MLRPGNRLAETLGAPILATSIFLLAGAFAPAQQNQAESARSQSLATSELQVLPVQGNIYLVVGAGGNITVLTGREGILIVDTGSAQMSDKVLAAVSQIVNKPREINGKIRYIIDTSADSDHVGGNLALSQAGTAPGADEVGPATILTYEKVVARMAAGGPGEPPAPSGALSTDSFSGIHGGKDLYFDDEGIRLTHLPAAHTDGDTIVYFRRNDVVSAGDIFVTTGYPVIDLAKGGSLQGVIDGLNELLDITIPGRFEDGGTVVVPGHGRLCDEGDLVEYRDMVTIIRDRIQAMIKKGATLDQVKAAKLTRDYDTQYGEGGPGAWPTDKFVEAAYRSLTQSAPKK